MKRDISEIIKDFGEKLPKFEDNRIDYTNSNSAPVVAVFVKCQDEFLLLRRSDKVAAYKGKWNTIAGYLDEIVEVQDKALEEVREELNIDRNLINDIRVAEYYEFEDKEIEKTWIINPVLVELKEKPSIQLDWEHMEHRWIKHFELGQYDTVTNLHETMRRALALV